VQVHQLVAGYVVAGIVRAAAFARKVLLEDLRRFRGRNEAVWKLDLVLWAAELSAPCERAKL
jgi:hypothetical protein